MKYLRNPFKRGNSAEEVYNTLEKLVSKYHNADDIGAKGSALGSIVDANRNLVKEYGKSLSSRLGGWIYKKQNVSPEDIRDILIELPNELRGENWQVGILAPRGYILDLAKDVAEKTWSGKGKRLHNKEVSLKEFIKEEYNNYLYKQFPEYFKENYEGHVPNKKTFDAQYRKEFIKNGEVPKNLDDFLIEKYTSSSYIQSSKDIFGIIIPKYINDNGEGLKEIPLDLMKEIAAKYDGISAKDLGDAYFVGPDREVSIPKAIGWSLATVAGLTFAYNAINGTLDFSSPIEIAKNFLEAKSYTVGHLSGTTNLQFDNTHVTGMELHNAHGDISMQDANVNLNGTLQGSGTIHSGTWHIQGSDGNIIYNQGTPYETTVPVNMNGTDITVAPGQSVTLDNFNGDIDGSGQVTGLAGTLSGVSGEITNGTITGGLSGLTEGAIRTLHAYPSYLLQSALLVGGAFWRDFRNRGIREKSAAEVKSVANEFANAYTNIPSEELAGGGNNSEQPDRDMSIIDNLEADLQT